MEEELNEHDLEERLYAMLHHVDQTQNNVKENIQNDLQIFDNIPKSTVCRYWRTSIDSPKAKNPCVINRTPFEPTKPKEERKLSPVPPPAVDLSIFDTPPEHIKSSIEIIEHENDNHVILDSSDEDEVVEVALPPKPTITIESSDEDELQIVKPNSPSKVSKPVSERRVSSSPVPSVVSSVSDEFIRGDCIALNISSRRSNNHSFDFSLHGSDLLDQSTPAKKKRKKKSKEAVTSTPIDSIQNKSVTEEYFATPKSKAKNKKKKAFVVKDKPIPNADVYDSDSNQSIIDTNKNGDPYVVTEKSMPSVDVYESDSNHSEHNREKRAKQSNIESLPENCTMSKPNEKSNKTIDTTRSMSVVDLTENDTFITLDNTSITENILMGNVTGFTESEYYGDENSPQNDISKYVSTKIPPILSEDLDFDNLKGNKTSRRRRYSLTTLRAEMDKFYNESWGGENFNHREIQKNMSRDKSLWAIDPKDRMPSLGKRKITCNYCNRSGHRDETCWMKPPVCYMCGIEGHHEPRCPKKICVNCGQPNYFYSTMCRNCRSWNSIKCSECGQLGHPASHCPDKWRRYHNTIDENMPLVKNTHTKKHYQLYCSGCARRGHLIHTCKSTLPFSGLPIYNPYVFFYRPIYSPKLNTQEQYYNNDPKNDKHMNSKNTSQNLNSALTPRIERNNKRQSNSPTIHEGHVNKKRNISNSEDLEARRKSNTTPQRKLSQGGDDSKNKRESNKNTPTPPPKPTNVDKAADFIPIISTNYDNKGHIIQHNEVSDTSDVVTSSKIYVKNDLIKKLKSEEGEKWLQETITKHAVSVDFANMNSFLSITGRAADQEAFQAELRNWKSIQNEDTPNQSNVPNTATEKSNQHNDLSLIPKNRNNLLQQLNKALDSLKQDIGDPKAMYKELTYFQNKHKQLLSQKTISPKQVSNNRGHINEMFKKLNMVLLGQAGLADGSQHLSELYSIQEKLVNSTLKNIPTEERKEIGQHYYSIFAAIPRDDYLELLQKFYQSSKSLKNKKNKLSASNPKMSWLKKRNCVSHRQTHNNGQKDNSSNEKGHNKNGNPLKQRMVFYHQRLLNSRPDDAALKKLRVELVRKTHSMIVFIFKNENLPSKMMKKMRKLQERAQKFLANV